MVRGRAIGHPTPDSMKIKSAAVLSVMFLVYIAWAADTGRMPAVLRRLYDYPNGDRVGHVVVYGILACLLHLAFPGTRTWLRRRIPVAVTVLFLFGTAEEFSQGLFPRRTPDPVDLSCTWFGIVVGYQVARRLSPVPREP